MTTVRFSSADPICGHDVDFIATEGQYGKDRISRCLECHPRRALAVAVEDASRQANDAKRRAR